jgi:hypothetical protein
MALFTISTHSSLSYSLLLVYSCFAAASDNMAFWLFFVLCLVFL